MKTKPQSLREIIPESEFPQLYSKRGLERNRMKIIMPNDPAQLAYVTDKDGNRLNIEL